MYWQSATRIDCVANTMALHRWEAIKRNLHFADNVKQAPIGDPAYDKLYKPDIGASSNIVLTLSSIIPDNISHKLFFDNWFSSVDLQMLLEKRKIHCLSTVRTNRLAGCCLPTDQDIKRKGRGAFEERETIYNRVTLRAVKWHDNRAVTLLSTFASANPASTVMRWDKKRKTTFEVKCPSIVTTYNKGMGGVDLLDSLIALNRTKIRSKKWLNSFNIGGTFKNAMERKEISGSKSALEKVGTGR
ncbi:hypothetical protein PGIGA_G00181870 [Pangasianodon gigas]|uniref:Uncharacterized protein n=1 Tax=Pangasianodon gigas TaxID=30993 RepID=A0ACC5XWF9_PANGG|nr:hypothetical protein [Pangasianodon gigas]